MKRIFLVVVAGLVLLGCANGVHRVSAERFQMNTFVQVVIYARDRRQAEKWASGALDVFAGLEERYSIHLTNSLLFDLNHEGRGELDDTLLDLWPTLERLYEVSGGLFDPTVEPLVRLWGFYDEAMRVPSSNEIARVLSSVGFSMVKREGRRINLRGRRLDLGGILKGYALDLAVDYLRRKPAEGFLVNIGGNIAVWGDKPDQTPWTLAIRHPRKPGEVIALFSLTNGSVATSGDYEQFFIENGVRYHHIFHPRTGYPESNGVISVTVVVPTGVESDGFSTVLFLLGRERGMALADELGIGVCYIMEDLTMVTNRFFPGLSPQP